MGQHIEVETTVLGDVAVFDTDRSITGQDGTGFSRDSDPGEGFPARLARRLFEGDPGIDHVFVASSQVVVRRTGGWEGVRRRGAAEAIGGLFVFYGG